MQYNIRNKEQLKYELLKEWSKIDPSAIVKLIVLMQKQMKEILKVERQFKDH